MEKKSTKCNEVKLCGEFYKNNYGLYNGEINYEWDIDHIEPISNLQPLCSYTNRFIKKNKLDVLK